MDKETKELIIKDLCARIPYGVKVAIYHDGNDIGRLNLVERFVDEHGECWCATIGIYRGVDIENLKPYLRPMSSMTEEEAIEYSETDWFE